MTGAASAGRLWVMVAGPYRSGAADAEAARRNRRALHEAALAVLRRGHVPVVGVDLALPLIEAAGTDRYEAIMDPLCLALVERCDAVLRIGGASRGADREVARFRALGRPVYTSAEEIPAAAVGPLTAPR